MVTDSSGDILTRYPESEVVGGTCDAPDMGDVSKNESNK
jgi:hypothetical protein